MVTVRNKFDTLQEISERHYLNDEFETFLTARLEGAAAYMPTKLNTGT